MQKYVWVSVLYISRTKNAKSQKLFNLLYFEEKEEKINLDWKIPVSFLLDKYVPQVSTTNDDWKVMWVGVKMSSIIAANKWCKL